MSILIRGMEMPTSCCDCQLFKSNNSGQLFCKGKRIAFGKEDAEWLPKTTPNWCPLVHVPPHGRLIDADELAQQYVTAQEQRKKDKIDYRNAFINNGEPCTEWWCVEDMLENAPTIIPASEEGEL